MIVPDASFVIEVLSRSPLGMAHEALLTGTEPMHAPHLIDLEIAQVLRRVPAGAEALALLRDLPIERHPHAMLLSRIWDLRHNLSAYDAAYVALAELLGATLVTCDHAVATARHTARVRFIR